MKIGIITFHAAHNYGSMLQAWALQTYLQRLGHEVVIVNYRSAMQMAVYHKPLSMARWDVSLSSVKRFLLYPSSIKPLNRKWHRFEDFMSQYMNLTKEYHTLQELKEEKWDLDLLICGSDQIWNTHAPDSNEVYYGNWFKGHKIAYAASMGNNPRENDVSFYRKNVIGFSKISVRESQTREMLLRIVRNVDIKVVCDPTLLLNVSDYSKLSSKLLQLPQKPYIFFYTPVGLPTEYFSIANKLSEQLGIEVYTEKAYYPYQLKEFSHIHTLSDTGPLEFLDLIRNASLVIGGSFHLQVFSILFHKDFLCINGDRDSRTNNLLSLLGLQNRIISLSRSFILPKQSIEWAKVDSKVASYRDCSLKFLHDSTI
jgi:polysaccharide pyruvyl transferase WcaK-like protein